MWFVEIIQNAELKFLFMQGNGLGAILLAFVLIALAFLLRPVKAGEILMTFLKAGLHRPRDIEKPPRDSSEE